MYLPGEILTSIFSYLDYISIVNQRAVCSTFNNLSRGSQIAKIHSHSSILNERLDDYSGYSKLLALWIKDIGNDLKDFHVDGDLLIDKADFIMSTLINRDVTSLNSLTLGNTDSWATINLNEDTVKDLFAKCCLNLKKLVVYEQENLGYKSFREIANFKHLEDLSINECHKFCNGSLRKISEKTTLKSLDLIGCERITNKGFTAFENCKNLKEFRISRMKSLSGKGLKFLWDKNTKIEKLSILDCENVRSKTIKKILDHNLEITHLTLDQKLDKDVYKSILSLKKLAYLHICQKNICTEFLSQLFKHKTIKKIIVDQTSLSLDVIWKMPNNHLMVINSHEINDGFYRYIFIPLKK